MPRLTHPQLLEHCLRLIQLLLERRDHVNDLPHVPLVPVLSPRVYLRNLLVCCCTPTANVSRHTRTDARRSLRRIVLDLVLHPLLLKMYPHQVQHEGCAAGFQKKWTPRMYEESVAPMMAAAVSTYSASG